MKITATNPAENLFLKFCEGYKKRDLALCLSLFTEDATNWGTGIDEYRVGLKQMEAQLLRDWSQSEKGEINVVTFTKTPANSTWTAAICNTTITIDGKDHSFENLRATVLLSEENGVWKIAHTHASFPDMRNPDGGSFPVQN